MPADSDPIPSASSAPEAGLPTTFRPFGVRLVIAVLGILLVLLVGVMWFALPADVRAQFTGFQIGTVVFFGLLFYSVGFALARSCVVARADGLTVVNGYRSRTLAWNEIIRVTLTPGSPWAMLDLSDGTTLALMGIQGSDGPRAVRQVREVRALVSRLTR